MDLIGADGNERFKTKVGSAEDAPYQFEALLRAHHVAREMLNDHSAGARINKRVLLFTNCDAPLKPGEDGRELISQWREFSNVYNIYVELLSLPRAADRTEDADDDPTVGPGGYCSPHHRMSFDSMNKGSKCVA